jgi:peptidoglycan/xylan/chitin deacetylase (PgdA/CDA1 family)
MNVYFTVDMEQDCPPYRNTFRGVLEGTDPLLALLKEENVRGTFFTTGDVAARFPATVERILESGHELACHGHTHESFATMDEPTARTELTTALEALRPFSPIRSFRAPYLSFPDRFLSLLEEHGFALDSSQAKYKPGYGLASTRTSLARLPASVTSSVLRLPAWMRDPWLSALADPVVLFVHPWEFVDWRHTNLRWDCRFKTGESALDCLKQVLQFFKTKHATFSRAGDSAA